MTLRPDSKSASRNTDERSRNRLTICCNTPTRKASTFVFILRPKSPNAQNHESLDLPTTQRLGQKPKHIRQSWTSLLQALRHPTRCSCNHDKEGMQVSIGLSNYPECCTYEIELNGELPDGTWVNLHNHGMPNDLEAGLATIPRLLAAWEFIANHHQPTNQTPIV